MASDGPSDLQNAVIKTQTAAWVSSEIRLGGGCAPDAYPSVAARLKQSSDGVKRAIQDLGRSAPAKGADHGAQSESLPRLLRYLHFDSR